MNANGHSCQLTPENKEFLGMMGEYIPPKNSDGSLNAAIRKLPLPEMHLYEST